MNFFGRDEEMASLQQQYTAASSFSVLYGRRRVGKTRLLVESIRGLPAIYFTATESSRQELLRQFMNLLAEHFSDPLLGRVSPEDWTLAAQERILCIELAQLLDCS